MSKFTDLMAVLGPYAAKINGLLTGWDGTKYNTPGEAVRQQIADLHVLIGDEPGTAIPASAISYGESDVETALDDVSGRLQKQDERIKTNLEAFPTDTASGASASFSDGADKVPVKSLVVGINPVQSGEGDPSPDNVRPISGWTGATITTCGKNVLMNTANAHTNKGVSYAVNADGSITANGTATGGNGACYVCNIANPSKTLLDAFSGKKLAGCPEGGGMNAYVLLLAIDGAEICRDTGNGVQIPNLSQYYGASTMYINASVRTNYTAENLVFKPMISENATYDTYEPYSGESIDISFPTEAGTVYGGTLDVTNGVLTVTKGFIHSYNGETLPGAWISDRDVYAQGTTPTTGAEVCFDLDTPITYQLTPTEINSLLGSNTIYANTGDATVEYRADTTTYINRKIAEAISALS